MPKVVHLANYFWPHGGGVEHHLDKIGGVLNSSGYQQSIITLQHDSQLPLEETYNSLHIHRLKNSNSYHKLSYKFSIWLGIVNNYFRLRQADIIHIHDVFWWLLPLLPFLNRKKLYITFHGYEGSEAPKWKQIFWHRAAAWWTNGNICIGDFHKKWYGVEPTYVSYGGVEKLPKKLPSKPKSKRTTRIIFIGRLHQDNGIMQYLAAIKLLLQKNSHLALDVYGEGPLSSEARQYVKVNRLPVTFYGFIPQAAKKISEYEVAFISRYLGIVESLSVGTPLVAHYNNSIKHDYLRLAPFARWIAIARTPEEIVRAVIKNKPLPKAAQHWAQTQTWEKVADMYTQLWHHAKK